MHLPKYISLILLFAIAAGCRHPAKMAMSQQDSLYIKENTYTPLPKSEAYAFINQFILPYLDSMGNGRQVYIHPLLISPPLSTSAPQIHKQGDVVIMPPPPGLKTDSAGIWDAKLLKKVKLITDNDLKEFDRTQLNDSTYSTRWRKKFGYGYMLVSYPAYQASSGLVVVRTYSADDSQCGNGRDYCTAYVKTDRGWKLLYHNGN